MVRLISILKMQIIRLMSIHFVKFRIFTPIPIYFLKFLIFTLISINFVNFKIFTQISIYFAKFRLFTLIPIHFINFRINTSISIHIIRKLEILHVRTLWLLYLDKHDKFFYSKKSIESSLFANYWAAISRICKNAVFWSADQLFLFHFVRINKLNAFAGDLPTEKLKISS